MAESTLAEKLVALVTAVKANALPSSVRDAVYRNSLQVLGVARLGLQNPIARDAVDYIARFESGRDATIVAHGVRAGNASSAAFANALASHADFREDTHSESSSHPGVVVMPAVLAIAELKGGRLEPGRYVEAVVAGHEMIGRLGGAAAIPTTERGFRPPSVYTVFGGTVAAGMALGLDAGQQVNALAIAAQGASGITHPFFSGTDEWFLAPALAARHAVTSALLAQAGVAGSREVFEGAEGVFTAFAGGNVEVDLSALGSRKFEVERTRLKAALTCGWNQSLVNQLREMSLVAGSVKSVDVKMSLIAGEYPGVAKKAGFRTRSEALLSAPFATALQLVRGSLDHDGYALLDDPQLLAVADRVSVSSDPALQGYATVIDAVLDSGKKVHSEDGNDAPRFSLDTADRVLETLRRNYASAGVDPARVDALAAGVRKLVDADDATAIGEALGG
ncbi:MmgE/PrpD family protein [Achromobacter aloeverae]